MLRKFLRIMSDEIHEIRKGGNLFYLLNAFIGAYNRRTDVMAQSGDSQFPDLTLIAARLETIHGLVFNLDRKVDTMSSNIDRIEKEAADAAENVNLVRTAVEELRTVAGEMKTEIAALKEQVAQGQLDQARLDAAASTFEKADDDIDAVILPPAPGEGGGDTGGGTTEPTP